MRRQRNLLGPQGMGGMVGLWGASSLIENIQYGTISFGISSTSATATITAVDTARTLVFDLRQSTDYNGGVATQISSTTLTLTNSTTVTAARAEAPSLNTVVASFVVVQLRPGIIRSVQYGLTSGQGSPTQTITSVDTGKSVMVVLGETGNSGGRDDAFYARGTLTNATTLTFTRGVSTGSGFSIGWMVAEFF